jgi:rhamnosyltransferase
MVTPNRRVAIGFVTYHPGDKFFERLRLLADLGYVAYVFDNSPENERTAAASRSLSNIRYLTAGKNVGLGFSLSVIAAMASYDEHETLLFFDQDTSFTSKTILFIQDFADRNHALIEASYVAVTFDGKKKNRLPTEQPLDDVMLTISSGSLFCLSNLAKIGWHNETYFVDGVDYEMCLRARSQGFRIGKCAGTEDFDHVSEQPDRLFRIFGRE